MITVSDKKLAANRANAALSSGPKTPEGKARSSKNAVRHGLLAAITKLPAEVDEAFADHVQGYYDQFHPSGEFELGLVDQMAVASWHLLRAFAIENQMLVSEMDACTHVDSEIDRLARAFGNLACTPQLNTIHRYQTRLHNMHSRILRELILIRKSFPPSGQAQSALPNEPKSPCPLNEFQPSQPTPTGMPGDTLSQSSEPTSLSRLNPGRTEPENRRYDTRFTAKGFTLG